MALFLEVDEIDAIVNRLLDDLAKTVSSQTGAEGVALRNKIGVLRAGYITYLRDNTFGQKLLDCFTAAHDSGASLLSLVDVRKGLFDETPQGEIPKLIVDQAIVFCMATESRTISEKEYKSRDDVDAILLQMKTAFDTAKEILADIDDPAPYQALTSLAGALTKHLVSIALPLPRMIDIVTPTPLPALAASYFAYYDASRWEELVDGNKIVHPAFCRKNLRGLAS